MSLYILTCKLLTFAILYNITFEYDLTIKIIDKDYELDNFKGQIIDDSLKKMLNRFINDEYELYGKIVEITSLESFKSYLIKYNNVNHNWIFLFNDKEAYKELQNIVLSKSINSMVFNKDNKEYSIIFLIKAILIDTNKFDNYSFKKLSGDVPHILLSSIDYTKINNNYSYENSEYNTFADIKVEISNFYQQKDTSKYLILSMTVLLILTNIFSRYMISTIDIEERNKLIGATIWISNCFIIISFYFTIYLFIYGDKKDNIGAIIVSPSDYMFTLFYSVFIIFKSILIFLTFTSSYGWGIYISNYTKSELKWILMMFFIIYISVSIELIFSSLSNIFIFSNFTLSDFKDIIFYTSITLYISFCCCRGIKLLKVIIIKYVFMYLYYLFIIIYDY